MCLSMSGACNSVVVVCCCVTYLFLVHYIVHKLVSFLDFLFELISFVILRLFIADYAVWAFLIVEGCTVTYGCKGVHCRSGKG